MCSSAISRAWPMTRRDFFTKASQPGQHRKDSVRPQTGQPTMNDERISSIVLPNILKTALRHGIDVQSIFKGFGITLDPADIGKSDISAALLLKIIEKMAEEPCHCAISLHIGKEFGFEYMPHVRMFVTTASTVREASRIVDYLRELISPLIGVCLKEEEGVAVFELDKRGYDSIRERFIAEAVFAAILWLDELSPYMSHLREVHFRHGETRCLKAYEDMFQVPVFLNSLRNAVVFDAAYLDTPLLGASPETNQHARKQIEDHIKKIVTKRTLSKNVTRLLESGNDFMSAPVEKIARKLRLSSRSLQRGLMHEGTTCTALQNRSKARNAARLLESPELSVEDVSDLMGFCDRRSFTRAFKRWTGLSPSAFRKNR